MAARLVVFALTAACSAAPLEPSSPNHQASPLSSAQEERVELAVAKTSPLAGGVTVTFLGVVEDSRCPEGVSCVWEGDAVVELRISGRRGQPVTLRLRAHQPSARSDDAHGVRFTLERLEPKPTADGPVPVAAYRATVLASRLQ